jgi:hypothetical protein
MAEAVASAFSAIISIIGTTGRSIPSRKDKEERGGESVEERTNKVDKSIATLILVTPGEIALPYSMHT